MRRTTGHGRFILVSLLLLSLIPACSANRPVRYHTLPDGGPPGVEGPAFMSAEPAVAIGPVTLPDYVNRPQIVTRSSSGEVNISESDRWAGPLEDDVTRVLTEHVSALLRSRNMAVVSWRRPIQTKVRVPVTIVRLDAVPGQKVRIVAQWTIQRSGGTGEAAVYEGTFEAPAPGPDHRGIVTGLGTALAQLGERIAQSVTEILVKPAG